MLPASNITSVKVNLVLSYCMITCKPAKSAFVNAADRVTFPFANTDVKLNVAFSRIGAAYSILLVENAFTLPSFGFIDVVYIPLVILAATVSG